MREDMSTERTYLRTPLHSQFNECWLALSNDAVEVVRGKLEHIRCRYGGQEQAREYGKAGEHGGVNERSEMVDGGGFELLCCLR